MDNARFKVHPIIGDLHKLEPTDKFSAFPAGQAVDIPIINEYWQLFMSDVIPRWYVTSTDAQPKSLPVPIQKISIRLSQFAVIYGKARPPTTMS